MSNSKTQKQPMTKKQKQAAVVCAVCALALVLTASITGVLVSRKAKAGSQNSSSVLTPTDYDKDAYVVDSGAVLAQTADAGDEYVQETLFIGDSNTVRLYNNGLVTLQQFCAQQGLGIQTATSEKFVTFKSDDTQYTIPEAVAKMKPRRVVITLGTNNASGAMSTSDFISAYRSLITAIQTSYSYTDIIINAIPPVPADHSNYPDIDQGTIDDFNMALADLCEETGCKFLNSAEALKDENGYGAAANFAEKDIHMTATGLKTLLEYYRTHAYETEDRRPDTDNIAQRAQSYTSTSNSRPSVTATPSPSPTALYSASYYVESTGGGTLTSGSDTGKSELKFSITDTTQSITVQAVPNSGYIFVKWSDGVTTPSRTDTKFTRNVNVTAMFAPLTLTVSGPATLTSGSSITLQAALSSESYAPSSTITWYVNNTKVEGAAGTQYAFAQTAAGSYTVHAQVEYNGTTITSNTLTVTVAAAATPDPTPTPTPAPTSTPAPTPTPTPEVTPSPTPESTPSPTPDTQTTTDTPQA